MQAQLRLQGHAQTLGRALAAGGRRDHTVDQRQMRNPLGQRPGQHHRDNRTEGVPQQRETLPAQLLGHLQHIMDIVPEGITGPHRAVSGMPMAGHVEGDDTQPLQLRRKAHKTVGVIQPAMQGNHRQTVFRAEQMSRQFDMRQTQAHFLDSRAHG